MGTITQEKPAETSPIIKDRMLGVRIPTTLAAQIDACLDDDETVSIFVRRALRKAVDKGAGHASPSRVEATIQAAMVSEATSNRILRMLVSGQTLGEVCDLVNMDRHLVCRIVEDHIDAALNGIATLSKILHDWT